MSVKGLLFLMMSRWPICTIDYIELFLHCQVSAGGDAQGGLSGLECGTGSAAVGCQSPSTGSGLLLQRDGPRTGTERGQAHTERGGATSDLGGVLSGI